MHHLQYIMIYGFYKYNARGGAPFAGTCFSATAWMRSIALKRVSAGSLLRSKTQRGTQRQFNGNLAAIHGNGGISWLWWWFSDDLLSLPYRPVIFLRFRNGFHAAPDLCPCRRREVMEFYAVTRKAVHLCAPGVAWHLIGMMGSPWESATCLAGENGDFPGFTH